MDDRDKSRREDDKARLGEMSDEDLDFYLRGHKGFAPISRIVGGWMFPSELRHLYKEEIERRKRENPPDALRERSLLSRIKTWLYKGR